MNKKKLFIFDISPNHSREMKDFISGKIGKFLRRISEESNIVLISHSGFYIMSQLISDIGLKKGFIISDNGARIYNIATKSFIFRKKFEQQDLKAAVHHGIMFGSVVLISCHDNEIVYSLESVNALDLNKKHYVEINYVDDYNSFQNYLSISDVYSVMLYTSNSQDTEKWNSILAYSDIAKNINISMNYEGFLLINCFGVNKKNAIFKLMNEVGIDDINDVQYFCLTNIDADCINFFPNHLVVDTLPIPKTINKFVRNVASTQKFFTLISDSNLQRFVFDGTLFKILNAFR